jgi:exportin-1
VELFVPGLFIHYSDHAKFKLHLRDSLIQLKEFVGENNADLYLKEQEKDLEMKKQQELDKAMRLPGLLKPSEQVADYEEL